MARPAATSVATVIAVMDRRGWSARTDNIVVVQPLRRRLLWVPRDLWCATIGNRVNTAFARGGHEGLLAALAEHRIVAGDTICVQREATERVLAGAVVTVPVLRRLTFSYPLSPQSAIEDGSKLVVFDPPSEALSGERIHQWVGARTEPGPEGGSDLHRIARQQVFLRCLLRQGFDFGTLLEDPKLIRVSSSGAISDLRRVQPTWRFVTLGRLVNARLDGKAVLVRRRRSRVPSGRMLRLTGERT